MNMFYPSNIYSKQSGKRPGNLFFNVCQGTITSTKSDQSGTPWQPEFSGWAFNLPRGADCLKKWQQVVFLNQVSAHHHPRSNPRHPHDIQRQSGARRHRRTDHPHPACRFWRPLQHWGGTKIILITLHQINKHLQSDAIILITLNQIHKHSHFFSSLIYISGSELLPRRLDLLGNSSAGKNRNINNNDNLLTLL